MGHNKDGSNNAFTFLRRLYHRIAFWLVALSVFMYIGAPHKEKK